MAMTIKIGHASSSENYSAHGTAGDQRSGEEVCVRDNYNIIENLKPNVLLRPKTSTLANASAIACEAGCANNKIGYSQSGRNTLYSLAKDVNFDLADVSSPCNTDCSAFMTVCAIAGGARISYGTNAPTTTNMRTRFKQSGDYSVLTDSKHLNRTDYLKRGDILVCEGSHTVMVLENGIQYADEVLDPEDPGSATGITPTRTIRAYSLNLDINNIKTTAATIEFKIISRINNTEKVITNISKWSYRLTLKALNTQKVTERVLTDDKITLTNLVAGNSYVVQVSALKADGTVAFCSAAKLFTTEPQKSTDEKITTEFGDKEAGKPLVQVDKIYIKVQDEFKQAIVYKNK